MPRAQYNLSRRSLSDLVMASKPLPREKVSEVFESLTQQRKAGDRVRGRLKI